MPERIAVVGAGPAGLTTAVHLTDPVANPGWQDRYSVDVYTLGWRIGGKGATGRNPEAGERIEEHGIHVFGNMYFNTLRMMRDCYEQVEWDDHDRYRTMDEAFLPSLTAVSHEYWNQRWGRDVGNFPSTDEPPWLGSIWPDDRGVVEQVLNVVRRELGHALVCRRLSPRRGFVGRLRDWAERLLGDWIVEQYTAAIARARARRPPEDLGARRIPWLERLNRVLAFLADHVIADSDDIGRRAAYLRADLAITTLRGAVKDDLFHADVDSIDGENYRDWLQRHGASKLTLCAAMPQALPNTALSYAHGDTTAIPTMSAAAFVTFFLREVTGKGAGAYFFAEGTGETVMKPLYRLLHQRGVRFHFFHKLSRVVPAEGSDVIDRLEFDVQATVRDGSDAYDPLRRLADGELVWPDRPRYEQLVEGDDLRDGGHDLESWWSPWVAPSTRTLRRGDDFDRVVLATPISTLRHTCGPVLEHPAGAAWGPMVANVQSAATQAVQLWLTEPTTELGWDKLPEPHDRMVGGVYGQDLTSFCDFSDLVAQERWPADDRPQGLIYLIGALSDPEEVPDFTEHDFPERQHERIKWATIQWLRNVDGLLPKAARSPVDSRSFDFSLLHQHDRSRPARGVNTMDQQFWKANIDPNERYTLTVAGTLQHRLHPWSSGFANLVLAGDWVYTGFNIGSFEGAVMSGKLASLTLTGSPSLEDVHGYDFLHPHAQGPDEPPPLAADGVAH